MEDMFISILNMSLTASYVIAVLMLARLFLKKAPKIVSYALWAVAGFRLVFPFSFESMFSLIPFKSRPIPADIAMQPIPRVDSGIRMVDNVVSQVLPVATPAVSVNPLQIWLTVGSYLWLAGIAVMLIYSAVSILLLKQQLDGAMLIEDNIYEADNLKTPFVLGLFRPRIYIPTGLSEEEKRYIILHERTHIRRHDHIVKFFAYFILCLHWFNPFVWVAFLLMGADMEMSCDERVLKEMGGDIKKAYSNSLLSLATGRHLINGSPLAFGEDNIKERIKNVLNFKKPAAWVIVISVALVAALSVGFAVNRAGDANGNNLPKVADIERIVAGTPIEEVHRILGEPSGQLSGFRGDIYVLEDSKQAVIYYDPNGAVEQVKLSINENWYGNFDGKKMTLNDVKELARKGEALNFDDFKDFRGGNASSNLDYRIMLYVVEGGYRLIVRTDGKKLDSVNIESIWEDGGSGIDIRYKDVDEFIKTHPSSEATGFQPSAPEWSPEQRIDIAGIPELDYASDDIIIFHGYFGLFVYDLDSQQIIRSLDLQPLNCAAIQGDDYCEVTVSTDGNTVQLHRLSSENMYIYTVSANTLRETTYERMSDRFGSNFVPIEDVVDTERLGNYSSSAVKFDTGEYGFLHISDWTLGTLSYIRGDMIYRLFDKEGYTDRATPKPTADSLKLWEQE